MSLNRHPIADLITGFWGERILDLTETVWTWLPSLAVISVAQLDHSRDAITRQLTEAGYRPIIQEPLATICQFLGVGVLYVVAEDRSAVLWATQDTVAFAQCHPVVLGFAPLLGGVLTDAWSLPPLGYGTVALRFSATEMRVIRATQLDGAGIAAAQGLRSLLDHLLLARERKQAAQVFDALFLLFTGQMGAVLAAYARHPQRGKRRITHHGRVGHRLRGRGQSLVPPQWGKGG